MSKPTYLEWLATAFAEYGAHLNKNGDDSQTFYQYIPNHLSGVRPDIRHQIQGTEVDCYHTGDLQEYLNEVRRLWDVPKMFDGSVYRSLISKLAIQVEYTPGRRYLNRTWADVPRVSGVDTHDQCNLTEDEEDLLRQIGGIES